MKEVVLHEQSLLDIAIQTAGSPEAAYELALVNNLSLTDELKPGQELERVAAINADIENYYTNKNLKPATGFTQEDNIFIEDGGISIWAINVDFVVQ